MVGKEATGASPKTVRDVEQAYEELKRQYDQLVSRNLAGVYRTTIDGRFIDCNDSLARILGYPDRDILDAGEHRVYGPWGLPDMAPMLFTKPILEGRPIDVFNEGRMSRDFTYIDDIVAGVVKVAARPATGSASYDPARPDPSRSHAPYRIYNIGNNEPVALMEFIATLEAAIGAKAKMNMLPMQPGDVPSTYADIDDLERDFGYRPRTQLADGIKAFVAWYREFYRV